MNVRILGCHGGVAPEYQTSCYSVNHRFLIDCGSACSILTPQEQFQLTDIFITHPHLDHIKDIAFLCENTFSPDRAQIALRSTQSILQDVHKHLLNDVLWPDFSKIHLDKKKERPMVRFDPITDKVDMDGVLVQPFRVNHPGHAVGYLLDDGEQQVIFSGDTGPCPMLWKKANQCKNLKAVFTEITFPSRMEPLAKASGHFTLEQLLGDLNSFTKPDVPVYISHFKPLFMKELLAEFYEKAPPQLQLLHENDFFEFA